MKCDHCNKKATVHLTEIVDGKVTEMHLCEDCAREKSVQMEQQFGLADLLAGLADFGKQVKDYEKTTLACPHCKLTYDDFKKFGRLGCSECYTAFRSHLGGLLKRIHGSSRHLGKAPAHQPETAEPAVLQKEAGIDDLRRDLQAAVEREDFEKAAQLRDRIRDMENNAS